MIVLGVILLLLAAFLDVPPVLWTIGLILIAVGLILAVLGTLGRAVGPRRHYW